MIDLTTYTTSIISALTVSIPYIIGALIGACTTLVVYSLNEHSKNKEKKDERLAARRMIKFEIDHDLKLLEEFFIEINEATEENNRSLGYNMGNLSFPPVDKAVFNKYSFLLSDSKENEFEMVYNFYRNIGDLEIIHSKTTKLSDKSYNPVYVSTVMHGSLQHGNTGEKQYSNKFTELWKEFETIINYLIQNGNPISL
jgi:hypothetical protein